MDFTKIKPALKTYLKKVEQHIHVSEALVFGSVAKGQATSESDIDVLILSKDFANLDEDARDKLLYRLTSGIGLDLHLYGLTPQEFAGASKLTALGQLKNQKTLHIG